MGIDKFLRNIAVKGISTLVGSVSIGHLTVKSGSVITGPQTFANSLSTGHLTVNSGMNVAGPAIFANSGSVGHITVNSGADITGPTNITGATAVNGNLSVASRFLGVQGLTQGVASIPVGSTYAIITTGAVSSQSAIIPQIVTDIASTRLLDTFIGSITVGTGFAITLSAPAAEATDVRWLIIG